MKAQNSKPWMNHLSPHPAEMREPAANAAQALLSHIRTCSHETGGQVFLKERERDRDSLGTLQTDENHPMRGNVCVTTALREIRDEAPFPVIVLGLTEAQMCKLSHELLHTLFYTNGKAITGTRDDRLWKTSGLNLTLIGCGYCWEQEECVVHFIAEVGSRQSCVLVQRVKGQHDSHQHSTHPAALQRVKYGYLKFVLNTDGFKGT